jgi:hypothetical protein
MYTCSNNVLTLLPALPQGTAFSLTVSNPDLNINGWPVNAGDLTLAIGGTTESFCPTGVVPTCPPGNVTALVASGNTGSFSMDVEVPGGQLAFLNPFWDIGYTQAHSANIPSGSLVTGLAAYQGGGFVNLNGEPGPILFCIVTIHVPDTTCVIGNGAGWVACPPTAAGGGNGQWALIGKNATNAANLNGCSAVNLEVNVLPSGPQAWEYT